MKRKILVILAIFAMVFWGSAASATTVLTHTYSLDFANCDFAGCAAPYATVTVNLDPDANTANFVFTAQGPYIFGGNSAVDLNLNPNFAHTFSYAVINVGNATGLTDTGSGNLSQFGVFSDNFNSVPGNFGPDGRFTKATIYFTDVTANTLDDLFAPQIAGAHVLCPITGITGYVVVPIPPSALLLGFGLLGLVGIGWRRERN